MDARKKELEKVKRIIKKDFNNYCCGIFKSRNIVGDFMENIFTGKYFTLDGCYEYSYYELFGTSEEEWYEIYNYYRGLR